MQHVGAERGRIVRMVAELAVIVVGVFLGLAADSWRESRVERGRAAAHLSALAADVSASLERIDEGIRIDSTEIVKTRELLAVLRGTGSPTDPNWRRLLGFGGADVILQTGTVRSLIGTGDIRLINPASLRTAIVSLAGSLDYNLESIRIADQHDWASTQDAAQAREAIAFAAGRPDTISLADYRSSPALSAAYQNHAGAVANHLFYLRELRGAFERVGELLELQGQS